MDPITCFSLAGTILQFLDFTWQIISNTHQLSKDGSTSVQQQAAAATTELLDLTIKLQQSQYQDGSAMIRDEDEDEDALKALCHDCEELAEELLETLNKLRVQDKAGVWKSLRQAILSTWNHKNIKEIEGRLSRYRDAINTRILVSLRNRINLLSVQQSQRFKSLDLQTQQIITALYEVKGSITQEFAIQIAALTQVLSRYEMAIPNHHNFHPEILQDSPQKPPDRAEEEKALRKKVAIEILESLAFTRITTRFEAVSEAHASTYRWILDDQPRNNIPWSNFVDWLQKGTGVYWISGKAGSGKSTLMKYILENQATVRNLAIWAKDSKPYIANFFFWNSGTKLQKSQPGLLRALLYDVLRQIPELTPIVLPQHWAKIYFSECRSMDYAKNESWPMRTLLQAWKTLISQEVISVKICLFIDGLDEYEGAGFDLVNLFDSTAISPNIKICASSRPEIVYQDAFANSPGLRLQDMTKSDIQLYIKDRLVSHKKMQDLIAKEPFKAQELINEIQESANGVFLWVEIVVTSLISGLGNLDHISDLRRRLRLLPKSLEKLFEHMISKVDEAYIEESSQLFKLVIDGTLRAADYQENEATLPTILELSFALSSDSRNAETVEVDSMSVDQIFERCENMDVRLTSRCGGLLETQKKWNLGSPPRVTPDSVVGYLHRTVGDFLNLQKTRRILDDQAGPTFNPATQILKSCISQLNVLPSLPGTRGLGTSFLINRALCFAKRAEEETKEAQDALLMALDEIIRSRALEIDKGDIIWFETEVAEGSNRMLRVAIRRNLYQYIRSTLSTQRDLGMKPDAALLTCALTPISSSEQLQSLPIITTLLEFGADPNHRYNGTTPWIEALHYLISKFNPEALRTEKKLLQKQLVMWASILRLLLQHGADGSVTCLGPWKRGVSGTSQNDSIWTAEGVMKEIFADYPGLFLQLQPLLVPKIEISGKGKSRDTKSSRLSSLKIRLFSRKGS
ncbi:hypothetical protein V8E51_012647 [Hyaloscypha variabilis]